MNRGSEGKNVLNRDSKAKSTFKQDSFRQGLEGINETETQLQKKDPIYAKVMELYDAHINGDLTRSPLTYFPDLISWYDQGSQITKIRCLELILRLVQPNKWQWKPEPVKPKKVKAPPARNLHVPETTPPSGIGIVKFRLQQIMNRGKSIIKPPVNLNENESDEDSPPKFPETPVPTIIDWICSTLEHETDKGLLTIFFLFMKTHGQQLVDGGRLAAFHYKLVEVNNTYAKLQAFERLQMSFLSPYYRPQV